MVLAFLSLTLAVITFQLSIKDNLMNNATYTIAARKDTSTHAFTPIGLPNMTLAQARDVLESKQTQGDGFAYVIVNTAA
jgi:hypothetical protein